MASCFVRDVAGFDGDISDVCNGLCSEVYCTALNFFHNELNPKAKLKSL